MLYIRILLMNQKLLGEFKYVLNMYKYNNNNNNKV